MDLSLQLFNTIYSLQAHQQGPVSVDDGGDGWGDWRRKTLHNSFNDIDKISSPRHWEIFTEN